MALSHAKSPFLVFQTWADPNSLLNCRPGVYPAGVIIYQSAKAVSVCLMRIKANNKNMNENRFRKGHCDWNAV